MPLDPSIYNQVGRVNLGQGLSDIIDQQRARESARSENQLRMMMLGQQLEDRQAAQQAAAQKATAQRGQQLNMWLSSAVQSGRPIEQVLPEAIAKGAEIGVLPDVTTRHVQNVYAGSQTPQGRSDFAFTQAYPDIVAKQRAENLFPKPTAAPKVQLEPVIGPNGRPMLVPSEKAVGMEPYRAAAVNINTSAPAKPQPGFRNVQKDGEWVQEAVPGSKAWQDLKSKEATDRAFVQNTVPTFDKNIKDIEDLMSHKGFESIFGLTGAYTPDVMPSARAARAKLDQVVGAMETAGYNMMKSTSGSAGSMSQQEWPKMQTYFNIIKNSSDPAQVKEALNGAATTYRRMQDIAKESYMNEWGTGQFGDPKVIERLSIQPLSTQSVGGAHPEDIQALINKHKR